jgi:VWFA-related protein
MSHRIDRQAAGLCMSIALILTAGAHGQKDEASQPTGGHTYTLQTGTNLVVVDITVTDQAGHPVKALKAVDFNLLEDGRHQQLRSFEEHSSASSSPVVPATLPKLQPGLFTNFTPTPAGGPANILLLDTLNTPLRDQSFVRSQLVEYLRKAPAGTQIAIFGLSEKLSILQGFTSDPAVLRAAVANKGNLHASSLLDDAQGGAGGDGSGASSVSDALSGLASSPDMDQTIANVQQFEAQQENFQLQLRTQYTLDALNELARYLESVPGRKNLIWFSGSFPVDIVPSSSLLNAFQASVNSEAEFRETVNLLARSRVAVYPVDARGLMTMPGYSASVSGKKYQRNPQAATNDVMNFAAQNAQENGTMSQMAEDTGGQAFFNTNGLSDAVASAIAEGSSYYTLTYSPTNHDWNGSYRAISIALAEKGYRLSYRRGYFADDPNQTANPTSATAPVPDAAKSIISRSMLRGAPVPTQLVFTVRVLPASATTEQTPAPGNVLSPDGAKLKGPYRRLAVDFAINSHGFTFTHTGDHYRDDISFITFVYDQSGTLIGSLESTMHANFDARVYAKFVSGPFSYNEDVSVPATGNYFLRIAVQDLNTSRVGAIELPVSSVLRLPPLNP